MSTTQKHGLLSVQAIWDPTSASYLIRLGVETPVFLTPENAKQVAGHLLECVEEAESLEGLVVEEQEKSP